MRTLAAAALALTLAVASQPALAAVGDGASLGQLRAALAGAPAAGRPAWFALNLMGARVAIRLHITGGHMLGQHMVLSAKTPEGLKVSIDHGTNFPPDDGFEDGLGHYAGRHELSGIAWEDFTATVLEAKGFGESALGRAAFQRHGSSLLLGELDQAQE